MKHVLFGIPLVSVALSAFAANPTFVDVMVAYDQSAQSELSALGKDLSSFAQQNIDVANTCLANSGLATEFQFRLVGVTTVAADTSALRMDQVLTTVGSSSSATGVWKQLWKDRDACGADLFSLVNGGELKFSQGGLGYTLAGNNGAYGQQAASVRFGNDWLSLVAGSYCFNVVSLAAVLNDGGLTMAHELGHNLGCGHPGAGNGDMGCYDFSHGAYFGGYVSLMGYPDESHVWAPVFSSPSVAYDGVTTGDSTHDNVRTLRANYSIVAGYRKEKADASIDEKAIFFEKAVTRTGVLYDAKGAVVGVLQVKIGATNRTKLTSKVSGSVQLMDGKKVTIKAASPLECASSSVQVACTCKDLGTLNLTVMQDAVTGTFAEGGTIAADTVGGVLNNTVATFDFGSCPELVAGNAVITQLVSAAGEKFDAAGTKWVFAKASTVKFKDGALDEDALERSIASGKTNKTGLKLTYTSKTGTFKGSFQLYAATPAGKLKKTSVNVFGFVINGKGLGRASIKKGATWSVGIR